MAPGSTAVEERVDPLLAAKIAVPAAPGRVVERRLALARLGAGARLVLVSAPAGFGKSTFAADWLRRSGASGAWVSLDPADNDVVRFARTVIAAMRGGAADGGGGLPAAVGFDEDLALARILEGLACAAASSPRGAVLVLDDYHLVGEPAIHRLVGAVVDRLPPGARLAIVTREDPPIPLARLRANGGLAEVRADDLRFSPAEAAELLALTGLELGAPEVELLTARTEGWAAALRLAGISLRGRQDRADLVGRFGASHRFVLDFILEEVLAGLDPDVQQFLLRTSVLERLCAPLCDAVTGLADSQARLEALERANLLITPLDDERRWYRYHALFAEILRARLAAARPGEVAALHLRASLWHEAEGHDDEAILHARLSGDVERTSWIVSVASGRHLNAGEIGTVVRWLESLPDEVVRGHAQLSASFAWCLMVGGRPDGAAERIDDAERALAEGRDGGPELRRGIPPQLAMLRSQLAGVRGDAPTAVAEARRALDLVPGGLPPEGEATLRGTATVLLALALRGAGELDAAERAYEAGIPELRRGGNVLALGRAIADVCRLEIDRGDAAAAARRCEGELARPAGPASAAGSAAVWAALAAARLHLGAKASAEEAARRAVEIGRLSEDGPSVRSAERTLARLAEAPGSARDSARPRVIDGPSGPTEALTAREVEVLRLVALGRSNSQIAEELFVTVGTVKSHLHALSGKLGAANRVEAVARGRQIGYIA